MKRLFATAALAALAAPLSVHAQEAIRVSAGFQPDPTTLQVTAGGSRDTATLRDCVAGFIPERPNVVVSYSGTGRPLNFSVQADRDTTLAIRTPDGGWSCNDDGAVGLNPEVLFARPSAGEYQVFVGVYGQAGTAPASLRISATQRAELRAGEEAFDPTATIDAEPAAVGWPPDLRVRPSRTLSLTGGFRPLTVQVRAGGDRDSQGINNLCFAGALPAGPSVRLNYRAAGGRPLTLSAHASVDTTLAVREPNGRWTCVDDSPLGLDPQISFARARSGRYDIFVGRFGVRGETASAELRLSNRPPAAAAPPARSIAPDRPPNPRLRPTQSLTLNSGFRPDPATLSVRAGGDRSPVSLGEGCHGVVSAAPTARITYRAGGRPLSFSASSAADTALIVRGPDGRWRCNDDFDVLNPRITFDRAVSGRYDVWVGRFNSLSREAATLAITETPPAAPVMDAPSEGDDLILGANTPPTPDAPAAVNASLRPGFQPDPYTTRVRAGGDRNSAQLSGTCIGVITAAPTFALTWAGGRTPLTFAATSEADTTLAVRAPDGEWRCNDDSDGLNPRVTFERAGGGAYTVYVGRFNSLEIADATLSVSERPQAAPAPSAGD